MKWNHHHVRWMGNLASTVPKMKQDKEMKTTEKRIPQFWDVKKNSQKLQRKSWFQWWSFNHWIWCLIQKIPDLLEVVELHSINLMTCPPPQASSAAANELLTGYSSGNTRRVVSHIQYKVKTLLLFQDFMAKFTSKGISSSSPFRRCVRVRSGHFRL